MSGDDDWDWDNGNDEGSLRTPCIFCKEFLSLENLLEHLKNDHQCSFDVLYEISQGSQYNFIKLINFIRKNKLTAEQVKQFDVNFFETIESNKFLLPTIDGDGLLMIDAQWRDDDISVVNTIEKMDELDDETKLELLEIKKEDDSAMEIEKKKRKFDDSSDD